MVTHGGDAVQKHLTVEVQDLLKSSGRVNTLGVYLSAIKPESGLQTFDSGDVLCLYKDPASKVNYEVHIDHEDLSVDEDSFQLSIRTSDEDGTAQNSFGFSVSHFTVGMKLQQNLWRLNKVTVDVEVPIGDSEFVKTTLLNMGGAGLAATAGGHVSGEMHTEVRGGFSGSTNQPEPIAWPPQQIVSFLTFAERSFAAMHPEAGFTCSLKDLAETSKPIGLDEQVNTGSYNGYHFALSGCEGSPAGSYQVIAEPLVAAKGAKAFCSDATGNVRVSEDGRGASCLVSGRVQHEEAGEEGMGGFRAVHVLQPEIQPAKQKD